jgi:hypothetical protein
MAHNSRIKAPGTWVLGDPLLPADVEQIDQTLFESVNGDHGGVWAPSTPIEVGGSGLKCTGLQEVTGELLVTGSSKLLGSTRIAEPEGALTPDTVYLGIGYKTIGATSPYRCWTFGNVGVVWVTLAVASAVAGDRIKIRWSRVAAPGASIVVFDGGAPAQIAQLTPGVHHAGEFVFDGTNWQVAALHSWYATPTGLVELLTYTAVGSTSWQVPSGLPGSVLVHAIACGGGGGGGGGANALLTEPTSGGGGGAGQLADGWAVFAPGATLNITVPAGGAGGLTDTGGGLLGFPGGVGGNATVTGPSFTLTALGGSGGAGGGANLGGFGYGAPGGPPYPVPGGTFLNAGWLLPPFVAPGHGGWGRRSSMGGSRLPCHGGAQRGFAGGVSDPDVSLRATGGGGGAGPFGNGGAGSAVGAPTYNVTLFATGAGGGGGAIHVTGDVAPHHQGQAGASGRVMLVVHHSLPGGT